MKGKLKLNPSKVKTPNKFGGKNFAFICFRNDTDKERALQTLDGYSWKGRTLKAKSAKAIVDPMLKRRIENAKQKLVTAAATATDTATPANANVQRVAPVRKTIVEATAPLAHLPYETQLKQKEADCIKQLHAYADAVKRINHNFRKSIASAKQELNGLPCIWHGFKASPCTEGYRNKNEFAIGTTADGEKIVGFRLGSYANGTVEVASINDVPHVSQRTKDAVAAYQTFIRSSKFTVFSPEFYTGQFRQFTVRLSQSSGELMLIVGLHTAEILDELDALKADIIDFFTNREGKELNVASLYVEEMNKREVGQQFNRMEHIYGSKYISDTILGLKFRISGAAFFQVNTAAAEVLYDFAIELGKVNEETSVLDICCGTGTIGLCFSKV